ncbi:MAG: hypothetical protein B1H05_01845 [Candidatus Cloacimonas sp. 4484_140]|nr:MAG: hypothetical protein B1H05_01845 [Candidatus Cloacimonas sp. 4484_140]
MVRIINSFLMVIFILFLTTGCTSKFEKAQREKQEEITLIVSEKISSYLSTLMTSLLNIFQEPSEVTSQNYKLLKDQFPEIFALLLYNNDLELQRKYPSNINPNNLTENCLTIQNRKNISAITKPFIGHSIYKNTNVYICITIPFITNDQVDRDILIVLVNTAVLFSKIEREHIVPYPYSLIVINDQQDVVYDSDPMRIGKDFLTKIDSDDYDPALKNLFNMMTENARDYFKTNIEEKSRNLRKIYTWNTIQSYDETFYVTLVRNLNRSIKKRSEDVYLLSTLRSYAIQDTLIDPIIEEQPKDIEKLLKYMYDQNPEVYSVQLADTTGTVISGWPPCNSIIGYCNSQKLNKYFDATLDQVINSKQENIIHAPLFEGGEGRIIFIPVLVHEDLYGVLIAIEPEGN